MSDDQPAAPGTACNTYIERCNIQAGRHVDSLRCIAFGTLHYIHLQTRYITERDGAPCQYRRQSQS